MTQASGHHLLARDSWLNDQALDRLEALSAISRSRLVRALPALQQEAPTPQIPELPGDRPALHCYVPEPRPWLACRACTLRASLGTTPAAMVRPREPLWSAGATSAGSEPRMKPPTSASPESPILTAHRHLQRLRSSNDPQLADDCVQAAWNITRFWAREPHCRPRLRARWHARAARLGPGTVPGSRVVTFPEAVALAEILTDPGWRRHVATAPRQDDQFCRRIAARLSEGPYRAPPDDDPVIAWAGHHRSTLAGTRERLLSSA